MDYRDIIVTAEDGIGTVTLDHPDKLQETAAAIRELSGRDDVNVIVLTGAGRAFCSAPGPGLASE